MSKIQETATLDNIHTAATQEFLEKGFQAASLRNIVKTAGVTTGAFYGYYGSKEELFDSLVGRQAEYVLHLFDETLEGFEKLSRAAQTHKMTEISGDAMFEMLDYIYAYPDAFKMIMQCAEGTRYADFVHQLVEKETRSTFDYIDTLKKMGQPIENINEKLVHMVSSGLFTGVLETVVHDMPKEEAKEYLIQLQRFHTAGWEGLLGVQFGE